MWPNIKSTTDRWMWKMTRIECTLFACSMKKMKHITKKVWNNFKKDRKKKQFTAPKNSESTDWRGFDFSRSEIFMPWTTFTAGERFDLFSASTWIQVTGRQVLKSLLGVESFIIESQSDFFRFFFWPTNQIWRKLKNSPIYPEHLEELSITCKLLDRSHSH